MGSELLPKRVPVAQLVKNLPAILEIWVRSLGWEDPWRRKRLPNALQYSGLENSMACIVVYEVAKSRTQLSDLHFTSKGNTGLR